MLKDDARGVGEPLDEVVCVGKDCQGLTVKIQSQYYWRALSLPLSLSLCSFANSYCNYSKSFTGQGHLLCQCRKDRAWSSLATYIRPASLFALPPCFYSWGILACFLKKSLVFCVFIIFQSEHFLQEETEWKSYSVPKASMMDANYSLPDNVAIVTLQVSLYSPSSTLYPCMALPNIHHSLTKHVLINISESRWWYHTAPLSPSFPGTLVIWSILLHIVVPSWW